ncbi:DUF3999 domain-containing protein [Desulfopila sp. IMCC35006]|uniref:DUF3999 domain-containing protein n=1 Tax=Desulfopila sp. IMCC35006 TaxID=2569542 RepID=UPI0010AC08C8|nr:DUF3999 domain-containing protein [Desulfopila sp. IMCC35006]TKB28021.1 DUF3999 domain-containing protein [Desulfopila sp. IMCC35006]
MRYLLLVLVLVCSSGQLEAGEITSRDFAAGYYLETSGTHAVYSVELPEEVYRTVKSAELADVRVFNGAGEVVPHEVRTVAVDPATLREKETIAFFPLFQQESPANNPAGIFLQVARDATGAIVNIKSDPLRESADQKITGYLLDLSHVQKEVSELAFSWQNDTDSSVFTVIIQQSNDLERWTPLVPRAALADLQFGGQQVKRRTIELPQWPMKYLKLTWQESPWPLNLTEVTGFSKIIEARRKRHWVSLDNGELQNKDNRLTVDFATGYRLPTSSVQIRFPQTNSVALLSVQSRSDAETGWQTRCEGVFHDLSVEGNAIRNEPCDVPATADSLWRVVVKQDGAGLQTGKGKLILQLGWQPSELFFIGRGTPPYLLAFGSGTLAQQGKNPDAGMLLPTIPRNSANQAISRALIGKRVVLSGALALQNPAQPLPWKKWLLWSVLVLGVGLLAFMARSLIKEMKGADEKTVAGK